MALQKIEQSELFEKILEDKEHFIVNLRKV